MSATRLGLIALLLLGVSGCVIDRGPNEPSRAAYYEQHGYGHLEARNRYDRGDQYWHEEGVSGTTTATNAS